jgi:PHP family Zn ribbon phosphoesterase
MALALATSYVYARQRRNVSISKDPPFVCGNICESRVESCVRIVGVIDATDPDARNEAREFLESREARTVVSYKSLLVNTEKVKIKRTR